MQGCEELVMPRYLNYAFAGIILGILVGVPVTYCTWRNKQYRNFHVVREGVLYRSGQLPVDGLKRLIHDYHIKTVVTLRYPPAPDQPAPDQEEERVCRELALHYFRLPHRSWTGAESETADRGVPAEANVKQFLEIMKDPRNHPVLVHCFAGVHRTGAMCAVYRMEFEQWTPDQAMAEMRQMGYAAHHRDVFGYLERYQPRGYAFGVRTPPADAGGSPQVAQPVHHPDDAVDSAAKVK
jgi:tyrosine-protein phosphatase SIW14